MSDLTAQAQDERYESVRARVAVQDSRDKLRLLKYYRDGRLLVLRVTDGNELNYSNVRVVVEGRDAEVRTDLRGLAWLDWDGASELAVSIDGAPGSRLVLAAEGSQ